MKTLVIVALAGALVAGAKAADEPSPLVIGETFTLDSKALGEKRRVNVYVPAGYRDSPDSRFPVLYVLDGGMAEDFLHIAGLAQVCRWQRDDAAFHTDWHRKHRAAAGHDWPDRECGRQEDRRPGGRVGDISHVHPR